MDNVVVNVEFTEEDILEIMKYQEYSGADTVQHAIMNAIALAFDDADK